MKKRKGLSMRYQITSDSTCDLSPEQLEQYHIRLLPLYVSMDGKTLRDGVDVKPDDIYAHVSAGGKPVTEEKEITIPAYTVVSVFDVSPRCTI